MGQWVYHKNMFLYNWFVLTIQGFTLKFRQKKTHLVALPALLPLYLSPNPWQGTE